MVIIVGAGPAGATAARTLARAGVAVSLLDRSRFPRNKPCGGGISLRVLKRFPYLERELGRIATHRVSRLYLEGPGGESTVIESDVPAALMIRRVEFDELLVSLAVEAGAELVTDAEIVQASEHDDRVTLVARDGRRFDASMVIAADGVHSVLGRRLRLNPGWPAASIALDMMEETPRSTLRDVDPSTLWVAYGYEPRDRFVDTGPGHGDGQRSGRSGGPARGGVDGGDFSPQVRRRSRAPEGYAYVFPKRDHVNIGLGYVLAHFRSSVTDAPYALQRAFVGDLRSRGVVEGESVRRNFTPFMIPVGGPLARPGRGRVLLAGDAGGFVNGFTAEGIYYAMVSGELAADAIRETTRASVRTLASRYRRKCDREIGAELRDSVLIQRYLFGDTRRIKNVIESANREMDTTRLILDFAVGRLTYRDLRRRLLARSPRMAALLLWERMKLLRRSMAAAILG
jgi:flavin-dependent dehydrogenase